MNLTVENKKLVVEILTTLAHLKNELADRILKPAGVSKDYYLPLFKQKNELGKFLSKREMAPKIIFSLENSEDGDKVLRNIIQIATEWSNFELANNEYQARATVQKAREVLNTIEEMEKQEIKKLEEIRKQREIAFEIARNQEEKNRQKEQSQQLKLMLMMYDELSGFKDDYQKRGYLLEDLIIRLFDLCDFPVVRGFRRNDNGEQIDGAFKHGGWHYIVEIKWRNKLSDIRQLDGLLGQVNRSGKQTMGMFLSIEGWSPNVVPLLKQNPDKSIFLMDGYDLRLVLNQDISLSKLIDFKLAKLNLEAEPYISGKGLI